MPRPRKHRLRAGAQPTHSQRPPPPLPQSDGPNLGPFADRVSPIKFIRILCADEPELSVDTGSGERQAHVFEVSIGSKRYALKIFHFYDITGDRDFLVGEENDMVTDDTIRAHRDPFNNECRAYGRLIEKKVNGVIAVRCYGYLMISAEREIELSERFKIASWDRTEEDECQPVEKRQPLRAVVKDLVSEDPPLTPKLLGKMKRDLRKMRGMGVYPMDVLPRNYKGGLLVDFSIAITTPHYFFDVKKSTQLARIQLKDLWMFQQMIDESGIKTPLRTCRDNEYCKKLRSEQRRLRHVELRIRRRY